MGKTPKKKASGKRSTWSKIRDIYKNWRGEDVYLYELTWGHIREHLNYEIWIHLLPKIIRDPDDVREDTEEPKAVWANFRFHHPKIKDYITVLIRKRNKKWVIWTAYDQATPAGGNIIWERKGGKKS